MPSPLSRLFTTLSVSLMLAAMFLRSHNISAADSWVQAQPEVKKQAHTQSMAQPLLTLVLKGAAVHTHVLTCADLAGSSVAREATYSMLHARHRAPSIEYYLLAATTSSQKRIMPTCSSVQLMLPSPFLSK